MLLVIDIGNTNITIGIYKNDMLIGNYRLTTWFKRTSDEYGFMILNFLMDSKVDASQIKDVIISSVVPKIMHSFTNSIRKYINKEPILVGPGIKTGISIKTENPKKVGADRIVDLAGCFYNYQGNALVIDFGTATTYDYISKDGVFKYGVTAPGIGISAEALSTYCAKLPEIEIEKPKTILATETITSMQAGLFYGYLGSVEYIIQKFKEELHQPDMLVIATGGLGKIISQNTTMIDIYDRDLTFKGLKVIYDKNRN
ncbi:type III pantothenate kinase [uncultured Traorella sp.]|uniref:type III pantothenate kinase n=1 Tax=uncultured Traorella sp. TaxID=1929048 RepID=UPI0025F4D788|nr:type III pantothenate kinase [uncultured Traorella sp.]